LRTCEKYVIKNVSRSWIPLGLIQTPSKSSSTNPTEIAVSNPAQVIDISGGAKANRV
jgi:hypothetical protein